MKVLQVHNYYQQAGGEDRVVEDERQLLESRGHRVIQYLRHNDEVAEMNPARLAATTLWSRRSASDLRRLIQEHQPTIAHFHNTLPLISPAGYRACQSAGVPVVQTLHNYRLACPKATLFRDGEVCEQCLEKRFKWPAVRHACYRDSKAGSAAISVMLSVHGLAKTYHSSVNAYIGLTDFAKSKMVEAGLDEGLIHIKPNFIMDDSGVGSHHQGYGVYLGRLSQEKGIRELAAAVEKTGGEVPIRIIGDGPERPVIDRLSQQPGVTHDAYIENTLLGEILGPAGFLVVPSLWYEGLPKVILEAFAYGLPVIASDLGSMRDVIQDGVNGRLFPAGDVDALVHLMTELHRDDEQRQRLSDGARQSYESLYTADINYGRLMSIYQAAHQHFLGKTKSHASASAATA
jgi:glycosyltransferase involved in cell wall biosynthesis